MRTMSGAPLTPRPTPLNDALFGEGERIGRDAADAAGFQRDAADAYCHRCGATMAAEAVTAGGCAFCRGRRRPWQRAVRLGSYTEPMRSWIIRMKFGGAWGWAEWFGEQLGEAVAEAGLPERTAIVPVPLHWMRAMRRGFDQSRLIALTCGRRLDRPVAPVLRRRRRTRPQSRIKADRQRWLNVRDAFAIRPVNLAGWHVVLVDDVTTTGATARACGRLLRRAGAVQITLAVVAAVDGRGGDFELK